MMKVTRTTFNEMAANRARKNKDTVLIQSMKKDGTWGKATEYQRYGKETDKEVVARLIKNNNRQFRLAE